MSAIWKPQIYPILSRYSSFCCPSKLVIKCTRCFGTTPRLSKSAIERKWERRNRRYLDRVAFKVGGGDTSNRRNRLSEEAALQQSVILPVGKAGFSGRKPTQGTTRRAKQLSVVLYEHISGLINSGEVCPQLQELGFQIEKVVLSPSLSNITVYWMATGEDRDDQIQALADSCAVQLRSTLINLHIMGHLPPIQFAKDLSLARLQHVQELLKTADLGEDYEPPELGAELKTEPKLDYRNRNYRDLPPNETLSLKKGLADAAAIFETTDRREKYGSRNDVTEILWNAKDGRSADGFVETAPDDEQLQSQSGEVLEDKTEALPQAFSNLKLRSDVYDIDHIALSERVVHLKRRASDRRYQAPPGESVGTVAEKWDNHLVTSEDISKVLAKQKRKQRRIEPGTSKLLQANQVLWTGLSQEDSDQEDEDFFDDDEDQIEMYDSEDESHL